MAGDWIKMRTWIAKDPKVIAIADFLATNRRFMDWLTDPVRRSCETSAYEHVTRHVTIAVTVTGLVQVWGVTRTDGRRDGDDLVIDKTGPDVFDEIAGVPGMGEAMEFVGWAEYDKESHSTTLPKFFLVNIDTSDLRKQKDAERKRRQRQKECGKSADVSADTSADVSRDSHAKVTDREEKRREETIYTQNLPKSHDKPEVRSELQRWMNHLAAHGKKPINPEQVAVTACQIFQDPCELIESIRTAICGEWVNLRRQPVRANGYATEKPVRSGFVFHPVPKE